MPRPERLRGPAVAQPAEIDRINRVFSEAFTDRYQRDGMSGVRVPLLNPVIWRFALAAAGDGALVWHDPAGEIVAFNLVHHSGSEGWMGPLAVRPGRQGEGIGALIVRAGIARLEATGARVIGIETMPRTVDNIGFYSRLGFRPEHLTVSLARELSGGREAAVELLSRESADAGFKLCRSLTDSLIPGVDFSREIALTLERRLGDVTLVRERGALTAFALWHSAPLAEGRAPDELRVLKLAAKDLGAFRRLLQALEASALHARGRRIAIRCQT
ncbi:MAG TPA: GNAT family N-acetyltransferase, partial [Gemmatimonadales bacterium]|nr:GNAT family N-acetyltransferase [Gemmatimonadales bacterium]